MMMIIPVVFWLLLVFPPRRGETRESSRAGRLRAASTSRRDTTGGRGLSGQVFRIAAVNHGRITVSDVVVQTGLAIDEVETALDGLVDGVHVRLECTDDGRVYYEFPEIIERLESQRYSRQSDYHDPEAL